MRVLALGIGGAGSRIVDILQQQDERSKVGCISAIAVDTDANSLAALEHLPQDARLYFPYVQMDDETFPSSFEIGEIMARIQLMNRDVDAVLICSGLGGTLSSSLEKVIKTVRSSLPEPIYALVTLPCRSEGKKISAKAAEDIEILNEIADAVIYFDNETWYNKIRSMMTVIEKTKSDVESRAEGIVPFRRITQEEIYYLLNDRIARQIGLILRAGEFDEYGVVGEVVLDAGEIINTLQSTRGAAAIGYAIEELPTSAFEKLSFFGRSSPSRHMEDENQRASRIVSLAKTAVYEDISIPCDLTSADKALVLIAGPTHEISMKGFYSVKKWIDRSISGIEMRSGDYPVTNTQYIGLIIMLAGLQNVPRIEELKLIREDLNKEKEKEKRLIEDRKREKSRRNEEERMQELARQRELERQQQEMEALKMERWEHEKSFYEEDQEGWTLVDDIEFLMESSQKETEKSDAGRYNKTFDLFEEGSYKKSLEDDVEFLSGQHDESQNTTAKALKILQPEDVQDLLEGHIDAVSSYETDQSSFTLQNEKIPEISTGTLQIDPHESIKKNSKNERSGNESEIRTEKITLSVPSTLESRYSNEPLERENVNPEFRTDKISVQAKTIDSSEELSLDLPSRAEKNKQDMLRMTSIGNTEKPKDSTFELRTISLDKLRPKETAGTEMTGNLSMKKTKGPNDSVFSTAGMKLDKGYGNTRARDGVFGSSGVELRKNIAPKDSSIDGSRIKVGNSPKTKELNENGKVSINKTIRPDDSSLANEGISIHKQPKARELLNDEHPVHISGNVRTNELLEGESVGMRQGARPKELLSDRSIKTGSAKSAKELLSGNKIRAGSTTGAKELLEGNVPSSGLRERKKEVKEAFSRAPLPKRDSDSKHTGADELLARSKHGLETRKIKAGSDMPPSRRLKVIENIQMNVRPVQTQDDDKKTSKTKKEGKSSIEWY